jgi:hypothetical protein
MKAATGADLVFLDPDHGLEVRSRPVGRKGSSKYAFWGEAERLWSAGRSLLVFQHYRREPRREFAARLCSELKRRTTARFVRAFHTPNVLYLLAAQDRHRGILARSISQYLPRWRGQIDVVMPSDR